MNNTINELNPHRLVLNDRMGSIGTLINYANRNLGNSNSTGVTRSFPKGLLERPVSMIDEQNN